MKTATPGKKIATLLFLCFISFSAVSCFAEQGDLPLQQATERDTPLQSRQWKELTQQLVSLDIQGNLKEAVRIGENFQKLAIEKGEVNTKEYAGLLMLLGNYNIALGYIEKGTEQLKESYRIGKDINVSPVYLANVEDDIARVYLFMLKCKEAEKFLTLAGNNLKRENQTSGAIFSQYLQSVASFERNCHNDQEKALKLFRKALDTIRAADVQRGKDIEGFILYNMAESHVILDNNKKALELLSKSFHIYREINQNHPRIMYIYYLLGRIYTNTQDYKTAMDYYKKSLSIARETVTENHKLIGSIYVGMGVLCLVFEEYNTAEKFFHKSIDLRNNIYGENTLKNATPFANLSLLYYLKKDYSKALEKSKFGLSLYKKNNYAPDTIYLDMLQTRLDSFQELGRKEEAQKCAELIKKYSSKIKN